VYNIVTDGAWGNAGQRYPWPVAVAQNGVRYKLDQIGAAERHDCRKFYVPPETRVTWAALADYCRNIGLHMAWNTEQLPYLGIWVDEGMYNTAPAVALEPSNGFYDSLARAYDNGRVSMLDTGETQQWQLIVKLTQMEE
jgi:hypothetical protein